MKVKCFLARQSRNQRLGDFTTETQSTQSKFRNSNFEIRILPTPRALCLCGASANLCKPGELSDIALQRAREQES